LPAGRDVQGHRLSGQDRRAVRHVSHDQRERLSDAVFVEGVVTVTAGGRDGVGGRDNCLAVYGPQGEAYAPCACTSGRASLATRPWQAWRAGTRHLRPSCSGPASPSLSAPIIEIHSGRGYGDVGEGRPLRALVFSDGRCSVPEASLLKSIAFKLFLHCPNTNGKVGGRLAAYNCEDKEVRSAFPHLRPRRPFWSWSLQKMTETRRQERVTPGRPGGPLDKGGICKSLLQQYALLPKITNWRPGKCLK